MRNLTDIINEAKKAPKGKRIDFEDQMVAVYNDKGQVDYEGILDYCPYKDDFYDYGKWNDKDKNYDLPNGYKMVGK